MTKHVKIAEAKTHLSALLVEVEKGGEFIITRGNQPVARLVPLAVKQDAAAKRRKLIEDMFALRDSGQIKPVTQEEIAAWKHEGHRY
jgi:prevent-host-death family protein